MNQVVFCPAPRSTLRTQSHELTADRWTVSREGEALKTHTSMSLSMSMGVILLADFALSLPNPSSPWLVPCPRPITLKSSRSSVTAKSVVAPPATSFILLRKPTQASAQEETDSLTRRDTLGSKLVERFRGHPGLTSAAVTGHLELAEHLQHALPIDDCNEEQL